ncbi:unnamed protein product [Paramecium primaurelia]|uniref:Uncharacterized protein n=1 Tax=Paramecium primaurelia TaxID=5886 RepID=A0A8S1JNQ7_PARPR|nr:unnamed protein product [Paramecium primaurelia]
MKDISFRGFLSLKNIKNPQYKIEQLLDYRKDKYLRDILPIKIKNFEIERLEWVDFIGKLNEEMPWIAHCFWNNMERRTFNKQQLSPILTLKQSNEAKTLITNRIYNNNLKQFLIKQMSLKNKKIQDNKFLIYNINYFLYLKLIIDSLININHFQQEFQMFRELLAFQFLKILLLNIKLLEAIQFQFKKVIYNQIEDQIISQIIFRCLIIRTRNRKLSDRMDMCFGIQKIN